jgi:hypothetical protein
VICSTLPPLLLLLLLLLQALTLADKNAIPRETFLAFVDAFYPAKPIQVRGVPLDSQLSQHTARHCETLPHHPPHHARQPLPAIFWCSQAVPVVCRGMRVELLWSSLILARGSLWTWRSRMSGDGVRDSSGNTHQHGHCPIARLVGQPHNWSAGVAGQMVSH